MLWSDREGPRRRDEYGKRERERKEGRTWENRGSRKKEREDRERGAQKEDEEREEIFEAPSHLLVQKFHHDFDSREND